MSSFEFVQLSQTLNDIVGIFQILLNRVHLNKTKQAYLYCLKPVLWYLHLFIFQTVFPWLHWSSSTMQACSLVFTYTLSIGLLELSDLLCFLIGLNQVGGRHEAQWGKK